MRNIPQIIYVFILSLTPLGLCAGFVLVSPDREPLPIQISPDASPLEKRAADELVRYLKEMTGRDFQTWPAVEGLTGGSIVLAIKPEDLEGAKDLHPHGYILRVEGDTLYIVGGTDEALMYAVYAFLEELGCRWWTHNEEFVPEMEKIEIASLDKKVVPAFRMHELMNMEASRGLFRYKLRNGKALAFTGGHNLCPMLKPYAEENPEFLPMNQNGERKFNNLHMNYTAEGMPEALATELGKEVEKREGNLDRFIYFAGMGDWYGGMDRSEQSERIYKEETWVDIDGREKPGHIAPLLQLMNRTGEILDEQYPGIKVGTFAYMSLEAPPAHTKPADNVYIWLPRLRHDTVRSIYESERNQSFLNNLARWVEIAPERVYIWEYGSNYNNFWYPFPSLRSIAENLRIYNEFGVDGVMIQGNYVSMGGDLAALKNWVWARLLWDPQQDLDALVSEFAHGYYGPAGPYIIDYVSTLENFVREPEPIVASEFRPIKEYISDEMLLELRHILERGLEAVKNEPDYTRRVREVLASVDSALLHGTGELEERDGKYIRKDVGEYTWERALQTVEHLRGASPREWGSGRGYQMGFLSRQGGPVANLRLGELRVSVAPVLKGRVSIYWDDLPIMVDSRDLTESGYALCFPDEDFGDDNASFYAYLGIGNWSPDTKQELRRNVRLEQNTVRMTGTLQQISSNRDFAEGNVAIESRYPVESIEAISLRYRDSAGNWHPYDMKGEENEIEIADVTSFALRFEDIGIMLIDAYVSEVTPSGKIVYDKVEKQLITTLELSSIALSREEPQTYVDRTVSIHRITD